MGMQIHRLFFTIPLEPDVLNGKKYWNLMRDNKIVTRTMRQVNCVLAGVLQASMRSPYLNLSAQRK